MINPIPLHITIDTNVLVHAADPRQSLRLASCQLINDILNSDVHICVDEGFHVSPARNASHIAAEYMEFLVPGSLGSNLIATLAADRRVDQLPRRARNNKSRFIQILVLDPSDRKFLAVAYNSSSLILYSHDFTNFPKAVRKKALSELEVRIINADE